MTVREEIELEFYTKNKRCYEKLSPEKKEYIQKLKKVQNGECKNNISQLTISVDNKKPTPLENYIKEKQDKENKKLLKQQNKNPNRKKYIKNEFNIYRNKVREITKQQNLSSLEHYDKRLTYKDINEHGNVIYKSETLYTLDHKISIWYGWKNNIEPELIGNISNLRYIASIENGNKGVKCFTDNENLHILNYPS